jgi:hypothetical protein
LRFFSVLFFFVPFSKASLMIKTIVFVSGAAVAGAEYCTEAQFATLTAKAALAASNQYGKSFTNDAAFLAAAKASMGTVDVPCAGCADAYMLSLYNMYGASDKPCVVDGTSKTCVDQAKKNVDDFTLCGLGKSVSSTIDQITGWLTGSGVERAAMTAAAAAMLAAFAL